MNRPLSAPTLELVAIVQSSVVFGPLIEKHPDLLELFIQASQAAAGPYRARLTEAVLLATSASDKHVEAVCSGDDAGLAKWNHVASQACEDLGRLLKQLVPTAVPIGEDVSSAPN